MTDCSNFHADAVGAEFEMLHLQNKVHIRSRKMQY